MYVEVLDHARHDGGGLGRAIGFSRQDSVSRSRRGTRVFGTFLLRLPLKNQIHTRVQRNMFNLVWIYGLFLAVLDCLLSRALFMKFMTDNTQT